MERLADKIRPESIKDIIGQTHLLQDGNLVKEMVKKNKPVSLLFYGRPGIGKTSMSIALSKQLGLSYTIFNATNDSKSKLIEILKNKQIKVLILEEIHRLNKDKQEILLPHLEKGRIICFASTTENPFFRVVPAIRSRIFIVELNDITQDDIFKGLKRVIKKHDIKVNMTKGALDYVAFAASGDFRQALNILEMVEMFFPEQERITKQQVQKLIPSLNFYSDRSGDGHYDLLSAFHKSLRGSDVDASLYYLACLIKTGDIVGMRRRMLCVAYEDIGMANTNVALKVKTACDVAEELGFPEARHVLSNAVTQLCLSPKSNSTYVAINNLLEKIDREGIKMMPAHLRDSHYKSSKILNRGQNYLYPHDFDNAFVEQRYLPEGVEGPFYTPKSNGLEEVYYANRPKPKKK